MGSQSIGHDLVTDHTHMQACSYHQTFSGNIMDAVPIIIKFFFSFFQSIYWICYHIAM